LPASTRKRLRLWAAAMAASYGYQRERQDLQEWTKFMEAEFSRLDKGKNGQLDVKELAQSKLRVSRFTTSGK
jgi:hypothetical protein